MEKEKLKFGQIVWCKNIEYEFDKNDPFFNINTKEDLEKAKEIFKND